MLRCDPLLLFNISVLLRAHYLAALLNYRVDPKITIFLTPFLLMGFQSYLDLMAVLKS